MKASTATKQQSGGTFEELCLRFRPHHASTLNVLLHLVTTPLGILAAISLAITYAARYDGADNVLKGAAAFYAATLLLLVPFHIWVLTAATIGGLVVAASQLCLTPITAAVLLAVAYVGQELSHHVTGETTYQSTYQHNGALAFLHLLLEHTYFLLPLCFDAAIAASVLEQMLDWFSMRSRVQWIKLQTQAEQEELSIIRKWLDAQDLPTDKTSHWWHASLPDAVRSSFDHVALAPSVMASFRERYPAGLYGIRVVTGMNEVYVAALDTTSATSDNVFYTNHVDGPWFATPCASLYRSIVSVNPNEQIKTIFPQAPSEAALTTGDVVAFDYNREVHRIALVPGAANRTQRYSLKVHYVVYPRCLPWYGSLVAFLNVAYNTLARKLFVKTLAPSSFVDLVCWKAIMVCTNFWYAGLQAVGGASVLVYVTGLAAVAAALRCYTLFLVGTSFVHYFIYMGVYYHRHRDTAYIEFKNRVMTFKALALVQMAYIYIANFNYDPVSLAAIAAGFALSTAAAAALGIDRTYFGVELQVVPPQKLVTSFPYNIPLLRHPMIAGNLLWLGGLMKMAGFRAAAPWLAPVHMALYTLHALQEEFGIKRTGAFDPYTPRDSAGGGAGEAGTVQ
eukprot:TRINITY_DN27317_c0_g1_i1.p1 TRINITY_DN27317_c0_g1~~TRINITY_DN27317_c0_g1_i1.p1  ORF type:complete len:621 (+),score=222.98 TRINITY_DN27317_c0_g1_i1:239-2101(+)